ncbi:VQ motif-containing protein 10 [Cardamine amara subsp. amara]|uniref:VQ motif-containing protein 10 n=1 Tax=Cardamine amara subsp. amara TaxID=228776 RepID=A0ABD1BPI4_CARAN
MSGRGKVKSEPMKVVFISTQYVETDARSFKNVVQELTGKNAIVAAGPFDSPSSSDGPYYGGGSKIVEDTRQFYGGGNGGGGGGGGGRVGTTTEFDRFFKEMPHMEDWHKLLSEN